MDDKFKEGDKVRIINYGSLMWWRKSGQETLKMPIVSETDEVYWYDMNPQFIGTKAIINDCINTQGCSKYSLKTDKGEMSWFNGNQLEKI